MADRYLIATWPCGCMCALVSCSVPAKDLADFFKENTEAGALVENVTREEYLARGGIVVCSHEPAAEDYVWTVDE